MILKRATKKVEHLGIVIKKGLWGFYPEWKHAARQESTVFSSGESAVKNVLAGYRPRKI